MSTPKELEEKWFGAAGRLHEFYMAAQLRTPPTLLLHPEWESVLWSLPMMAMQPPEARFQIYGMPLVFGRLRRGVTILEK